MATWKCVSCGLSNNKTHQTCEACSASTSKPSIINQYEKLQEISVCGYVRQHIPINNIPQEIIKLCLLFFLEVFDTWNMSISSSTDFQFSDRTDAVIATLPRCIGYRLPQKAFGSIKVQPNEIRTWKIRFSGDDIRDNAVGIIPDNSNKDIALTTPMDGSSYFFTCGWVTIWKANDILEITLDLRTGKEGRLTLKVNGVYSHAAFSNIPMNKTYHLFVEVFSMHHHVIEILKQ